MVIFTKVTGSMIKLMGTGSTYMLMGRHTKVNGMKTSKMVMESRHGLMGLDTKDIIKMEPKTVVESLFSQTEASTTVSLKITK